MHQAELDLLHVRLHSLLDQYHNQQDLICHKGRKHHHNLDLNQCNQDHNLFSQDHNLFNQDHSQFNQDHSQFNQDHSQFNLFSQDQ